MSDLLTGGVVFALWLALQIVVLPRLGVAT